MTVKEISAAQKRVLCTIKHLIDKHDIPPTYQEIANDLGITVNAVNQTCARLASRNYIKSSANKARSIRIINLPDGLCDV